jgi:4-hydroxy-3-polyprenylbenzoate decarboxylase
MYTDLREFIALVDKLGSLRRIEGADARFEIGAVTELAAGMPGSPALLFDAIRGFPRGRRIFTNAVTSPQRAALALGIDPALRPLDALKAWMEKRRTLVPHAPAPVQDAGFLQNSLTGDAVDLAQFPAPIWHRGDGGPFIGSGSIVVMRDPESSWINASIYRIQVQGPRSVTVQFDHAGRHGAIIARKYWEQGKPCPLAVVAGEDPALKGRSASSRATMPRRRGRPRSCRSPASFIAMIQSCSARRR